MPVPSAAAAADARARFGGARIAVVVPFVGDRLPAYFPIFAQSCITSAPLVDWLIMHSGAQTPPPDAPWIPSNVHFLNLGLERLGELHARLVDEPGYRPAAADFFADLLTRRPYYLVEFKVAIGHIFEEYLVGYLTLPNTIPNPNPNPNPTLTLTLHLPPIR